MAAAPIFSAIFLAISVGMPLQAATDATKGEKVFALHVKELLSQKCYACHSSDEDKKLKGELELTSRALILKGGESGQVLVPGNAEESLLYTATTWRDSDYEMPPKEADRLTGEQQAHLRDWINAGAPWPDDLRVEAIRNEYSTGEFVETSGGLGPDWTNRRYEPAKLWAYRPLEIEEVPADKNPVDWFLDRKLTDGGLPPAPMAGPRVLARRLSFGLTGLPPLPRDTKSFTEHFTKDPAAAVKAYAATLMASPHYGEHFGKNWLDVARYADTAGFANDFTRPNAWRYRDYVVRTFNEDLPYDQFVREQMAGDEIDPSDPEKLIATGFLRMGPWEQTGMSVFRITRQQFLDDVTDSVGQTFLAHAMQCAKCHDHKFDPLPTRDYYRMMAVFSTTQFAERPAPFLDEENKTGFTGREEWIKAKQASYQRAQKALNQRMASNRTEDVGEAKTGNNNLDPGDEASKARIAKNILRHKWELDMTQPLAFSVFTGSTVEVKNVQGPSPLREYPWGKGAMEKDTILTGGDAYSRGDPVTPGALSAAETLGGMEAEDLPAGREKRRLALAEWIVDEKNPLTARVMVNRVWSWHFGKGIAGNPNNFGGTGKPPTHPELLDYLANWFMANGWSVKRLNELILSSEAYRRASQHPDRALLAEKDPKGDFYATFIPRRLTAEELRDAMLAASGELNRQVGGIPARPDINMEVALQPRQIMGGTASVYEPDPLPAQRNRRSLYAEKVRGLRDPFFEAFNQPGPDKSCELRDTSTIAPQALTLFNSEEILERSLALAARVIKESSQDEAAIRRAFHLALGRNPTPDEMQACLAHWQDASAEEQDQTHQAKEFPSRVERTVMAEKTGKPYTFIEEMPAFEHYVPDLQRSDVDARTRALAEVCLVIFNLNEFAYLD